MPSVGGAGARIAPQLPVPAVASLDAAAAAAARLAGAALQQLLLLPPPLTLLQQAVLLQLGARHTWPHHQLLTSRAGRWAVMHLVLPAGG